MNRDYQQNFPRFAKYLWRPTCAMLGLVLTCNPSIAQETDNPQLSAWYQVEVVIFTQQGYARNEQPPKEYSLDFPENVMHGSLAQKGKVQRSNRLNSLRQKKVFKDPHRKLHIIHEKVNNRLFGKLLFDYPFT